MLIEQIENLDLAAFEAGASAGYFGRSYYSFKPEFTLVMEAWSEGFHRGEQARADCNEPMSPDDGF